MQGIKAPDSHAEQVFTELVDAKLNEHVWVIRAEQNTYALLAPSGETIFVGETK